MIEEDTVASLPDNVLKKERRRLMVKAKAIRRPARILEREIYRRSSHMSEDFHEGQSVCHVVGGQLMTGTIVEKDNVGAFIERPGVEKPVYILYFYLRPSDGITPTAQL